MERQIAFYTTSALILLISVIYLIIKLQIGRYVLITLAVIFVLGLTWLALYMVIAGILDMRKPSGHDR